MPAGPPPGAVPPQNNLVWGILTTIFCCLPLGIVSIVFAAKVNGQWAVGDYAGAQDSANKAKQFALWSAIAGAVISVLYIIFYIVVLGTAASTT
jgi:heme/copper-type cytochrome/quinol oxidase subunit 2